MIARIENHECLQLNELDGYNEVLELEREKRFKEFEASNDADEKREAMAGVAILTAARSPEFIASYEKAIGIYS